MDQPVNVTNDLMILNGYPDTDSISVIHTNNDWNITVWRDEGETVHMLIADNKDGTEMNLILGQDGFTQRC
jgi:hypothetical protein